MKPLRMIPTGALLLAILQPGLSSAQSFEGTVNQRQINVGANALTAALGEEATQNGVDPEDVFAIPLKRLLELGDDVDVTNISFSIKGNKMRVEGGADEQFGYVIVDFGVGTFQMVQPSERMYIEWTKEDFQRLDEMMSMMHTGDDEERAPPQVTSLDKTMEINGLRSSAYRVTTEDNITVVWVTDELKDLVGAFMDLEERFSAMGMMDEENDDMEIFTLIADRGFPVLTMTYSTYEHGTGDYEISEVVSVERQSLSDDLFAPPSDYDKKTMMDMMQGMPGMERNN